MKLTDQLTMGRVVTIEQQKISIEVARVGFHRMKDLGSHLPWGKVESMLKKG